MHQFSREGRVPNPSLSSAMREIQTFVEEIVENKMHEAVKWGEERSIEEQQVVTAGHISVLCRLQELMEEEGKYLMGIGDVIVKLAGRSPVDIPLWLSNSFDFSDTEFENFFYNCEPNDYNKFFNAVIIDRKYATLRKAALRQDWKVVDWLLGNGVDINSKDSQGCTVLHYAADENEPETVKMLLSKGADPYEMNAENEVAFDKALHCRFCEHTGLPAADLLLPHVFAGRPVPGSSNTRFHQLALDGDHLRLRYLLEKMSDLNIRNREGLTALHLGAMRGYPRVVETLLSYGASVNPTCTRTGEFYGLTPIDVAKNDKVKQILIAAGGTHTDLDTIVEYDSNNSTNPLYSS